MTSNLDFLTAQPENKHLLSSFGLGVLNGLNVKSRRHPIYEGTVPRGVVAERRRKARVAKATRKSQR